MSSEQAGPRAARAPRGRSWRRFARNPAALLGLGLTLSFLLAALLANQLAPANPFRSVGAPLQPPSSEFWLGTDDLGRDIFSGVVHGARTSLLVGFTVAGASLLIGVLVGGLAGFFGGWIDDMLMRFTELVLVMPRFFLALVVVALFGASLRNLILVLALTSWEFTARLTRAGVLSTRALDYVMAARAVGRSEWSNLLKHVLPNVMAPVIAYVSLLMGSAILIEAGLSFIGLGDPNVISWGYMLNNAQAFMRRAPWMSVFPGLAIALTVLGINLLGDGLNAYWNPRARSGLGRGRL
ncbi:MAG: ABC transporter permease [Deinococcota bacterium]|jgi:peptide/nickel transport system permease protein|nr:ABC transporter permease [Deinococcota bacterium]